VIAAVRRDTETRPPKHLHMHMHFPRRARARQTGKRPLLPLITLFTRFLARLLTFLLHSSLCRPFVQISKYYSCCSFLFFPYPRSASHRQRAASARAAASSSQPALPLPHRHHPSLCIRYTVPGASKVEHFDFTMMAPTASS